MSQIKQMLLHLTVSLQAWMLAFSDGIAGGYRTTPIANRRQRIKKNRPKAVFNH
jgi:hypothetical protein